MDDKTVQESKLLFQLCCDVGFSEADLRRRIWAHDANITGLTYKGLHGNPPFINSLLGCGSESEGTGMEYLGSDEDVMIVYVGTTVVEFDRSPFQRNPNGNVFQMIQTDHPAFVRLQLIQAGSTDNTRLMPTPGLCVTDEEGRQVLQTYQEGDVDEFTAHGPALTSRISRTKERDQVFGLRCPTWPTVAGEWLDRHRPYNWPRSEVIQEIAGNGCELVGVGNRASQTPHLEWRLSFTVAEKTLIRSFNIYQIQCYFLMKLVTNFLVKPRAPHTLCSYHIKTVMLHVVETTDPAEWTEGNLTNCFIKCLDKLQNFVVSGNCPQYFIKEHNLFAHRIEGESRRQVLGIVEELVSQGWRCVLQCPPLNNSHLSCRHTHPRCQCFICHWDNVEETNYSRLFFGCYSATVSFYSILQSQSRHIVDFTTAMLSSLDEPTPSNVKYFPSEEIICRMRQRFKEHLGYSLLHAASSIKAKDQQLLKSVVCVAKDTRCQDTAAGDHLLDVARRFLTESSDEDLGSGRLKLATFLYQTGKMEESIHLVHQFLKRYEVGSGLRLDGRERLKEHMQYHGDGYRVSQANYMSKLFRLAKDTVFSHVVCPVVFSRCELMVAPNAVKYVAERRRLQTDWDQEFDQLVFFDPLIYALYLLAVGYDGTGRAGRSRCALREMSRAIQSPFVASVIYLEVAKLLLEYCERNIVARVQYACA